MIKWKIVLDTMSSVNKFVAITSKYKEDLFVVDEEQSFRVSAKSMMGMLYTTEWKGNVYLTCETEPVGLYVALEEFVR
jgi:hypothetical protein